MEAMLLWQLSEQFNQTIHLNVFEHYGLNAFELVKLMTLADSEINQSSHCFHHYAQLLQNACIANIEGCQRLSFNRGQFIIDLYFGDYARNAQSLPFSQQGQISHWHCLPHTTEAAYFDQHLTEKLFWQMGRISLDNANIYAFDTDANSKQLAPFTQLTGFNLVSSPEAIKANEQTRMLQEIPLCERRALRQSLQSEYAYSLPSSAFVTNDLTASALATSAVTASSDTNNVNDSIAIIGGGIAAAHLALSLAEKGKSVTIYCKDKMLADGASGNKQGAIYPLLTPDNSLMSQYFQQAFLYSRRRLQELTAAGHQIDHQFCGVLQTGFDERSDARLNKIIDGQDWPSEIAFAVSPLQANNIAKIQIDKPAFYYPLAGWICPHEFANAAIKQAQQIAGSKGNEVMVKLNCEISALTKSGTNWRLTSTEHNEVSKQHYEHPEVVAASGAQLTEFTQTRALQVTGFRGQVSHIPSKGKLAELKTVICAHGYLTPENNQHHCVGASYVKSPENLDYCPDEQLENAQKMHHSFPDRTWVNDIDVSDENARVGVRMVTRDHCPMMGLAPDIDAIFKRYNTEPLKDHQLTVTSRKFWRHQPAPSHQGLYVLGGLGSRGLSSGPLAAEALASIICKQTPPISYDMFAMLNPNRMWLRKLLKGKSLI
ncbi:FAD-dependent 5-carboxymethylaminomethyl-2-thiouridine(34) oxidoreductase MnmC [Shewanella sp. 1_MG-2023]|uniref:FAD-dependent 5-carboxymethylaminomethyl-2-thiouridine(34) oxidoreductase MnmC n=1 Tax=unclassified Shewanella TaxID=196818 RepID=UPI0026E37C2E|nr:MULTISPECIES: FAD-dependent 5-carboxymethylaminomethyl-2-thiouridine(34) oxidoreductase MnmC [unclassified Shewanella]MDO6613613.1 FAD-dependent 5-carboxymethylaminomethyl-2-thiouridine(34) oxidoreductase MnmC [Shewanella sp. 7_MG-2023]MDO6773416.1 FAD-dependent 5-carboxymethylaminomethyl-2-thiouridine(34) oxidoreductase MnmC [Shewanella sp. 2_MG-2023]MDO6796263.1 FAD-dependent 5-carboxymethylaminomethyl-2-thiouridine(34) oxidoreductase MnmC [Shewanella sp. 1_MG-2023]